MSKAGRCCPREEATGDCGTAAAAALCEALRACSLVVLGRLAWDTVDVVLADEGEPLPAIEEFVVELVDEMGGRSVVAAVSAVAVLLALVCVGALVLEADEEGRPPEDVGRFAVVMLLPDDEGTLLPVVLVVVAVGCCWLETCRIEGARPSGLAAVAFSGPGGARCLVAVVVDDVVVDVVDGLLENIPESGLPEAVVVVFFAELAALLRAVAADDVVDDDEVVPDIVPDLVKGLIWGSRLGDALPDSLALFAPSLWVN